MTTAGDMNVFLQEVEKRAFRMAEIALTNSDDALDVVQDTMFTLVRKYAHKPRTEWKPLFYRILKNKITDVQRARVRRSKLFGFVARRAGEEDERDPVADAAAPAQLEPDRRWTLEGVGAAVGTAVAELPQRQQQAFMLRIWEGLNVADTANAMACSEGSVKTHLARALARLRARLEAAGYE